MRKAIITGANGFLGRATVVNLLEHGAEVIGLSRHDPMIDHPLFRFKQCDIKDIGAFTEDADLQDADVFYHFAWLPGIYRGDIDVQFSYARLSVDCLHFAHAVGCKTFIFSGTIMEKETLAVIYDHVSPATPNQIYAACKIMARAILESEAVKIGITLISPIITNVYGIGKSNEHFILLTHKRIMQGDKELRFSACTQLYDFIYITDAAEALRLIGERGKPNRLYNIGSGNARPLREFVLDIQRTNAPDATFVFGDKPGISVPPQDYDMTALVEDTGYQPRVTFTDGIRMTYAWLKERHGVQ